MSTFNPASVHFTVAVKPFTRRISMKPTFASLASWLPGLPSQAAERHHVGEEPHRFAGQDLGDMQLIKPQSEVFARLLGLARLASSARFRRLAANLLLAHAGLPSAAITKCHQPKMP